VHAWVFRANEQLGEWPHGRIQILTDCFRKVATMTTLESFIRSGALGPVVVGLPLPDLISALGEPQATSKKANPLWLKYGSVELSLRKAPPASIYKIREINVKFHPVFEQLPEAIALSDWNGDRSPTDTEFRKFLDAIGQKPIIDAEGVPGRQLIFESGVVASIANGMLLSIRYFEREAKRPKAVPFIDEREPSEEQILEMLDEADRASKSGADRAALLLGWAALEAALRHRAHHLGQSGRIGIQPSVLIKELFAAGGLSHVEHHRLEQLRQLRTAFAHGLAPVQSAAGDISEMRTLVSRLLSK
jgi:hypothetical protein